MSNQEESHVPEWMGSEEGVGGKVEELKADARKRVDKARFWGAIAAWGLVGVIIGATVVPGGAGGARAEVEIFTGLVATYGVAHTIDNVLGAGDKAGEAHTLQAMLAGRVLDRIQGLRKK